MLGSKDLLSKLLGPSAEYVGGEIKNLIQRCNINIDGIFRRALVKVGPNAENGGIVNTRVLKHILDEGRFCEDPMVAEYYAGILTASRGEDPTDDRAVGLLTELKTMSHYQIKAHYLIYCSIHNLHRSSKMNFAHEKNLKRIRVLLSYEAFIGSLSLPIDSIHQTDIVLHALSGMAKRGLIVHDYAYSSSPCWQLGNASISHPAVLVTPTIYGIELFLWAIGSTERSSHRFTQLDLESELSTMDTSIKPDMMAGPFPRNYSEER